MLLFYHFELGDSLNCNALVRHFCDLEDTVEIFVREKYLASISFMYSDLKNLKIRIVENRNDKNDNQEAYKVAKKQFDEFSGKKINCSIFTDNQVSKEIFYKYSADYVYYFLANVKFKKNDFFIQRDKQRELDVFKKMCNENEKYIFVHDAADRGFSINVESDLKIVRASETITDNIFDWLIVIEKAEEIHCINSSFLNMIDLVFLTINSELYFYHKIRPENKKYYELTTPKLRLNWILK